MVNLDTLRCAAVSVRELSGFGRTLLKYQIQAGNSIIRGGDEVRPNDKKGISELISREGKRYINENNNNRIE